MNGEMLLIVGFFACGVILGMILLTFISRRQATKKLDVAWYREQWQGINEQAKDGAAGRQLAILNADKLLDKAMKERGFKGENMGERLKKQPTRFSKLDDVWAAHKLRNRIAHENNVSISESEVQRNLKGLESGLKDLGAL